MAKLTQLHPQVATGRRYGSFVRGGGGPSTTTHPVGRLTQLRQQHATGRRYGSFAGRGVVAPVEVPALSLTGGGGGGGAYYGDPLDTAFGRKTEEFELMLLIEAALVVMEDT